MKIVIDQERCTGHGRCYTLVPALFDADEQGHSVATQSGPLGDDDLEAARKAVLNCPEQAITIVAD